MLGRDLVWLKDLGDGVPSCSMLVDEGRLTFYKNPSSPIPPFVSVCVYVSYG